MSCPHGYFFALCHPRGISGVLEACHSKPLVPATLCDVGSAVVSLLSPVPACSGVSQKQLPHCESEGGASLLSLSGKDCSLRDGFVYGPSSLLLLLDCLHLPNCLCLLNRFLGFSALAGPSLSPETTQVFSTLPGLPDHKNDRLVILPCSLPRLSICHRIMLVYSISSSLLEFKLCPITSQVPPFCYCVR